MGGARSGKSTVAERLAAALPQPVTYVATMDTRGDAELEARVEAHRRRRDPHWVTVEAGPDLAGLLRMQRGSVLLDSLGPWAAVHLDDAATDVPSLCAALLERGGDTVIVSDEVGLAVHPSTAEGRWFRDTLGALNHAVSAVADRAFLVVAGRALALPEIGVPPS